MKNGEQKQLNRTDESNELYTLLATVIAKLPHLKGRVPYTYHHDYLRINVEKFNGSSRSEVAANHEENIDELYAVALVKLLDELNFRDTMVLNNDDIVLYKKAVEITDNIVSRYNCG